MVQIITGNHHYTQWSLSFFLLLFISTNFYRSSPNKKRPNLPVRSFSLCSLIPGNRRKGTWTARSPHKKITEDTNIISIDKETERFENSFPVRLTKLFEKEMCHSLLKNEKEVIHSSSDSFATNSDSGAFSRVSSPDRDSEYSDFSDSSISLDNPSLQLYGNYSDDDSTPKKAIRPAEHSAKERLVGQSVHRKSNCEGLVTVNGVCYHCA